MPNRQRRSSNKENRGAISVEQGVGARHRSNPTSPGGGGYPDICKKSKISDFADPRLAELHAMRIPTVWLRVAQSIGVDNFLEVWSILNSDSTLSKKSNHVYVPRLSTYTRFQRNRMIVTLAHKGLDAVEIQNEIKQAIGCDVHPHAIHKILRKNRQKTDG